MAMDRSKVVQQAQLLASKGQYDHAVAEWQKLAAEAPHDGSIHNSIGDLHLKRNAMSEASAAFFQAATAFKAEGATLKAIAAYKKVLKCDPSKYEVYRHLGDLNADRGLMSSAVQDYLTLAKHYLKERRPKEALVLYQKIASHDPSNLNAQQRIAELCVQENRQDEATKVYLQLGRERSMQGRYEEANDSYLAVLRIDPKNSEAAQFVESVKKGGTGSITAVRPGTPASLKNPSVPLGPLDEAMRRMEEKQYAGAEAILNQVLSREPGNPQVCQLLARLHLQRGDLQVALGEYRFLAGAALRAQDFALAESLIKEFLSAQPDSVPLLELYGELYEERNDSAAAAQQYAKAVELLLAHPEPGMEGLHEELYEKVRSLSPDAGLVERLAVRMRGESPAAAGSVSESGGKPDAATSASPAEELAFGASSAFISADVEPDSLRTETSETGPGPNGHFSLEGAEPDGINAFASKISSEVDGFVLANAEPDSDGPRSMVGRPGETAAHAAQGNPHIQEPPSAGPPAAAPEPDFEAHFTLGVAFKNMGLYQEAREAFDIAKTAEVFYLDSSLMTALCYKEEGQANQAIQGLEAVLPDPRCQGAKGQAIRYELGLLYEAEAQWGKAAVTFQAIPSFHDVPQRLAALKSRRQSSSQGLRLAS